MRVTFLSAQKSNQKTQSGIPLSKSELHGDNRTVSITIFQVLKMIVQKALLELTFTGINLRSTNLFYKHSNDQAAN